MKIWTRIVLAAVVGWCVWGAWHPVSSQADNWQVGLEIRSVEDFYEPMSEHGHWVHREAHGWCWYPAYVAEDWRPYGTGHWQWTDQGWYWASDEPWSWACYHYGRWVWDEHYGWLWVPGIEWAPSWVVWREGGGYIGWAPMSPDCRFDGGGYVSFSYTSYSPHSYVFVEYGNFCRPIYPSIVIHHTYVHQHVYVKTVNCTKVKRVKNVIINEGPSIEQVERHAPHRIEPRPVTEVRMEEETRRGRITPPTPPVAGRVLRRDDQVRRDVPSRIDPANNQGPQVRRDEPRRMPVQPGTDTSGVVRRDVKPTGTVEQRMPPVSGRRHESAPGQVKKDDSMMRRMPSPESRDRSTTAPSYGKRQVQTTTLPGDGHGDRVPKTLVVQANDRDGKVR